VLVEHVQALIQQLADHVIVLDWGRKVAEGAPAGVASDPEVIRIYLGEGGGEAAPRPARPRATAAAGNTASAPLLQVEKLTVEYGKARALRGASIEVSEGELVAVVGANGAGKTSLALALTGMVRPASGAIRFDGRDITRDSAHARARAGISLCHEGRQLFTELSVAENLRLPTDYVRRPGPPVEARLERIYNLFPALRDRADSPAGQLSGGQQQMVAIGRALMPEPRLAIFDELSLGLAPKVIDEIFAVIPQIVEWGMAVMLIEQNVHRSLEIANRAYVIERGEVVLSGRAEELENVQDAYFGARSSTLSTGGQG
jgi:branched-chain amino acid transport system ATP-binding protein